MKTYLLLREGACGTSTSKWFSHLHIKSTTMSFYLKMFLFLSTCLLCVRLGILIGTLLHSVYNHPTILHPREDGGNKLLSETVKLWRKRVLAESTDTCKDNLCKGSTGQNGCQFSQTRILLKNICTEKLKDTITSYCIYYLLEHAELLCVVVTSLFILNFLPGLKTFEDIELSLENKAEKQSLEPISSKVYFFNFEKGIILLNSIKISHCRTKKLKILSVIFLFCAGLFSITCHPTVHDVNNSIVYDGSPKDTRYHTNSTHGIVSTEKFDNKTRICKDGLMASVNKFTCILNHQCGLMSFDPVYEEGDCLYETQFCRQEVCMCKPGYMYNEQLLCICTSSNRIEAENVRKKIREFKNYSKMKILVKIPEATDTIANSNGRRTWVFYFVLFQIFQICFIVLFFHLHDFVMQNMTKTQPMKPIINVRKIKAKCKNVKAIHRSIYINKSTLEQTICKLIFKSVQTTWRTLAHQLIPKEATFENISAIVAISDLVPDFVQVISIGTGSKIISRESLLNSDPGEVVLDSHATMIARRSFLLYLYENLLKIANNVSEDNLDTLFETTLNENGMSRLRIKSHMKLYLYVSKLPCGDAQIDNENPIDDEIKEVKGMLSKKCQSNNHAVLLYDNHIFTMKALNKGTQNCVFNSCSDKIAKWNVLGLQGTLLSAFIEPIYLDGIVVSSGSDAKSLSRAFYGRIDATMIKDKIPLNSSFYVNSPKIGFCDGIIDANKQVDNSRSISHNWYLTKDCKNNKIELIDSNTGAIYLKKENFSMLKISRLSKMSFMHKYLNLLSNWDNNCTVQRHFNENLNRNYLKSFYCGMKQEVTEYQKVRRSLEETFEESGLGKWSHAPLQMSLFQSDFNYSSKLTSR